MAQFSNVISLISVEITQDELLQDIRTETETEIFADKRSTGQAEFFNAGQSGIKSAFCFVVHIVDYNGETFLKYDDKTYSVYRTYEKDEKIELYCEERVGNGN